MSYTLGQAAKATGKAKSTLQRAIKNGRISANRDSNGTYKIDPSELHRVYPPVAPQPVAKTNGATPETVAQHLKTQWEEKITELKEDRDRWQKESLKWQQQSEKWEKQAERLALTFQQSQPPKQTQQQPDIARFFRPQEWAFIALAVAIIIGAAIIKA